MYPGMASPLSFAAQQIRVALCRTRMSAAERFITVPIDTVRQPVCFCQVTHPGVGMGGGVDSIIQLNVKWQLGESK